jgi:hypothetical protein
MLAGSDQLIKPDRMILGFLTDTLRRTPSVDEARRLLSEAAEILIDDFRHLTPRLLDYEVWQFQRARLQSGRDKINSEEDTARDPSSPSSARPLRPRIQKDRTLTSSAAAADTSMMRKASTTGMPAIGSALERAGRELQPIYAPNAIPAGELADRAAGYASCKAASVIPADFAYDRVNRSAVSRAYPMFIGQARGYWRFVGLDYPYTGPIFWKPVGEKERQVGFSTNGRATFTYDPRK